MQKILKVKRYIFLLLSWRLALAIPVILGTIFLAYRSGYHYTNVLFQKDPAFLQNILYAWANFDGVHYIEIARHSYTNQARFLPLFPLFIKLLSYALFFVRDELLRFYLAGLLLSNALLIALLIYLYKLVRLDFDKKIARKSLVWLLIFPTSFFLCSIYSENLFLLLVVTSLLAARNRNWLLAMLLAAFACVTRIVGIALIPALLFELYMQYRPTIPWKKLAIISTAPFLLIGYAIFNAYMWHNPLYFITQHTELSNGRSAGIILLPQTLVRYLKIFLSVPYTDYEFWVAALECSMFIYVVWGLWYAWKSRVRGSYLLFSLGAFLVPTLSGTFTGLPRYALVLFPIFIATAHIQNRFEKWTMMIAQVTLLFVLTLLFSRGYYVG